MDRSAQQPSFAFIAASWGALLAGFCAYLVGLWNAGMQLNEKGYYFTVLVYGLYAAISLQKSVRDRAEGIPVTGIYYGLSWTSLVLAITLLAVGPFNATLALSEKGSYAMPFLLALFGAVSVQKTHVTSALFGRTSPKAKIRTAHRNRSTAFHERAGPPLQKGHTRYREARSKCWCRTVASGSIGIMCVP
ncbi:hypothetical protein FSO04_37360 [Paraburkholderia madseniana]|uniref:YiaAB two helix domain-containing protein n=1 Tax=Paraburkholderia madseniana TaxID=2599607 RepID=A0A6N6W563_9BURK|nr:hypothetical protein FSO04_37360 [Paraburkholderia madseniana]